MRYFVLLLIGLLSMPAMALTRVNLYQAEVVMNDQHDNPEVDARVRAMQQVIVKATGNEQVLSNDVINKALRQSAQYANQISFGQHNQQRTLRVAFSGPRIRALLTQAAVPFWPEDRANILVWLVTEGDYQRNIAWEHTQTPLMVQLKDYAQQRGVPLTFPIGDFDDVTGIQISDLWGGFTQPIAQASLRYQSDAILVVRAQGETIRWALYDKTAEQLLQTPATPINGQTSGEQAIATLVTMLAEHYASQSGVLVSSESSQSVLAVFKPITNARAFFTLEDSLQRLSSVAALDIVKIQGDEVTFNAHLLASEVEFLQEVLRLRQVSQGMVPIKDSSAPSSEPLQGNTPSVTSDEQQQSREVAEVERQTTPLYFSWRD